MDKPEGDAWITTRELLAHAQHYEPEMSTARFERRLEQFRNQGLLPAARRIGQQGQRPIYGYPAETLKQLDALMLWRRKEKRPEWLQVLLWIDGWQIHIDKVRRSFADVMREIAEVVTDGLQQLAGQYPDPIAGAAKSLAARRGDNAFLARRGRMRAAARAEGFELLLRSFFDDKRPILDDQQAATVTRLLGEDANLAEAAGISQYSIGAATDGLLPDPALFGLHQLAAAAESVTTEELLGARRDIKIVAVWLPIYAAIVRAVTGGSGTIVDIAGHALNDPLLSVLLLAMVVVQRRTGNAEAIREHDEALKIAPELLRDVLTIDEMPRSQLERNLQGRPEVQEAIESFLHSKELIAVKDTIARQRWT